MATDIATIFQHLLPFWGPYEHPWPVGAQIPNLGVRVSLPKFHLSYRP